ncbi:MAG: hypothetical protein HQK81_01215 [Desulfovibrionaceae bacterium]|nr:hypothetical protein [Desulfovibrionaceae bacterium]MBF0512668.1 hypothetical protein [Desulfovibrionaceae bacterium]
MSAPNALIVGTAPIQNVRQCLGDFRAIFDDHDLHVLLKPGLTLDTAHNATVHPLAGSIGRFNLRQFSLFRRLAPARVVIVCGQTFWHHNVLRAVLCWSRVCGLKPKMSVFVERSLLFDGLRGMIDDEFVDF